MENHISCSLTSYEGFEDEICDILNINRSSKHTRQYLDWRYLGEEASHLPLIFWLRNPSGRAVGIVSLISRPYWINEHANQVWVVGDIAINPDLRGKGYGLKLFKFMNSYIENNLSHAGVLHKSQDLISKGYFGKGTVHPRLFDRIGDYIFIMGDDYTLRDELLSDEKKKTPHKANHGSLSDEELYVPLIVT